MPTITAVNNEASVPATRANIPNSDSRPFLFGTNAPIPQFEFQLMQKLAKPHKI
ncbi:MAG: hypothetical protein CM15mP23_22340 [Cryomorphaceae bacterium]|nr:MAG: hypothetical protein CM15mP23_22340 [Cryomorphaceae bacterium]